MIRGKNLELELVTFVFSAETSSELEAHHWKDSFDNFSAIRAEASLPKMGHHTHQVSGLQPAGKWPVPTASRPSHSVSADTTSSKNNCDFSRKNSSLASVHIGKRLLLHCDVGNMTSFVESSLWSALGYWTAAWKPTSCSPRNILRVCKPELSPCEGLHFLAK